MKDIVYGLLMVVFAFCFGAFVRGVVNDRLVRDISRDGEIRIYDDVYTCQLKGKWKSETTFIPAEK